MVKRLIFAAFLIMGCAGAVSADTERKRGVGIAGPDGVSQEIERTSRAKGTFTDPLKRYRQWKADLKEEHGVAYSLKAYLLYQQASHAAQGQDENAFGGIYRFQGEWESFGRETGHPGRLEWRLEYRSAVGDLQAPTSLSGSGALDTGFLYAEKFDLDLSILNWTQLFNDKRAGFAVGRLAYDVYLDPYPFQTIARAYLNRAFIVNPTMATAGIGALGVVAKGFVTDNIWVGGQVYDANAVNGEFDLDTIQESEWLSAVEIGWAPGVDRYKTSRVQLTYWHKDALDEAGVPEGSGVVFTASYQIDEKWLPFIRLGWSDGGGGVPAERSASTGFEYQVTPDQAAAFGAGWAKPADESFRDEYVLEGSYRWQVTPGISLMPDLQALFNPSAYPDQDTVWVGSLRCILSL
jgi:porin